MDKRNARFYYEGGKSLKEKINVALGTMKWLEKQMNDPEKTAGARKDARSEYNRLNNHRMRIIEHYEGIEARLLNEGSEFVKDLRNGFSFDS